MQARIDQNDQPIGQGISTVDTQTPTPLTVDPLTDALMMEAVAEMIAPVPATICKIDQNDFNTVYGISDDDGVTLVPLRTSNDGSLLIIF